MAARIPDLARFTPSLYGHSTGRYEGKALIVETVGLSVGNVTGGGRRRPETKLTERFELSPDRQASDASPIPGTIPGSTFGPTRISTSSSALPEDSYALETWCDSSDPLQRQSIVPPDTGEVR